MKLPPAFAPRLIAIAGIAAASFSTAEVSAQSRWIYSASVPTEVELDSNPAMRVTDATSVTRLRMSPQIRALLKTGRDDFEIDAAAVAERSSDPSISANRVDPRLRLDWRRAAPATDYGAFGIIERRAYRSLEVEEQVPVGTDGTRTLRAVGATVSHQLTEVASVSAEVRQDWVGLDTGPAPDYRLSSASAQLSHAIDERSSWYGSASHQAYRSQRSAGASAGESDSSGLVLGYRLSSSEALSWDVSVGAVKISGPAAGTSLQGSVKVDYVMERLQATLEAARRPGALAGSSSIGLTDVLRMQLRYLLDAQSSLAFEANASRFDANDRAATYAVSFRRELSPFLSLTARMLRRQRTSVIGDATANVIGIMLTYSHPDL